jgi:hypothetical protein
MANYYTTRFNPMEWPPASGAVPPGVVRRREDLVAEGRICCSESETRSIAVAPQETRWTYRITVRLSCPTHGETRIEEERVLDWISPNEYLLP